MCERGTTTLALHGKPVGVDSCIAPLVEALNAAGFRTVASCCGHSQRPGRIDLTDGRCIFLMPNYEAGQAADQMFNRMGYRTISGEVPMGVRPSSHADDVAEALGGMVKSDAVDCAATEAVMRQRMRPASREVREAIPRYRMLNRRSRWSELVRHPRGDLVFWKDVAALLSAPDHATGETREREMLAAWVMKHLDPYRPGAWEYDAGGAALVEDTARLLGVPQPWCAAGRQALQAIRGPLGTLAAAPTEPRSPEPKKEESDG